MPTPLHQLANEGRDRLRSRAEEAEAPDGLLELVRTQGRLSVNMKPDLLLEFLETGRRLNVFEWVEEQAGGDPVAVEGMLRDHLGDWYDRRLDFENRAGDGRYFHYGALNAGGLGVPERYGIYCAVDGRPPRPGDQDPVWIAEDSLEKGSRFRDADGRLSWTSLGNWVAPPEMAAELAAAKLAEERVEKDEEGSLAERLCSDRDYIEAASIEPLPRERVREIRSDSSNALQQRVVDSFFSSNSPHEDLDLDLHAEIRERVERLGIEWVEVTRW